MSDEDRVGLRLLATLAGFALALVVLVVVTGKPWWVAASFPAGLAFGAVVLALRHRRRRRPFVVTFGPEPITPERLDELVGDPFKEHDSTP
jgi:ribose/xylose/arabinose/galactoside ABC-type transport system permease subunit